MRYLANWTGRILRINSIVIVLDPPPLARSLKDVAHAARLYTDLNAFAMRALAPGGYLMTFSCSMHFRGEDFVRAVRIAQAKSGRKLQMVARLGPGPDPSGAARPLGGRIPDGAAAGGPRVKGG